jgi:hypothetical protein
LQNYLQYQKYPEKSQVWFASMLKTLGGCM